MASDYYKYGIANTINNVIDGADTLKEARQLVRNLKEEYPNEEYHIYLLDDYGFIKTWNDRTEV